MQPTEWRAPRRKLLYNNLRPVCDRVTKDKGQSRHGKRNAGARFKTCSKHVRARHKHDLYAPSIDSHASHYERNTCAASCTSCTHLTGPGGARGSRELYRGAWRGAGGGSRGGSLLSMSQ
eukprot:2438310-Pyramimonas_sp.AAC.2